MRPDPKCKWVALLLALGTFAAAGAEVPAAGPAPRTEETNAQEVLRSYIQLQEQLHAARLAIEENRKENAEAAARNSEALATRLQAIESALSTQRARELEAMQSSNRVMLIVAGSFAFVGVAAMLFTAFFQWRTLHGLAAISAGVSPSRLLGEGSAVRALEVGPLPLGLPAKVEQSSARLSGVLERLEQRVYQLENATRSAAVGNGANGNGAAPDRFKQLLAEGQALLDGDKPAEALATFEEALGLKPQDGEALVKKGTALERLQRLDEAVACYDAAIAADNSLTIAYLHKAGLFNRLEKFSEALEYYEKALSTQEKRTSA